MQEIYRKFCRLENIIANVLLIGIFILVFSSAIFRTAGFPINWAQDAALVAFAWLTFLGSDLAIRNTKLIGIEVIVKYFPKNIQKYLDIAFKIIIVIFLLILVKYGYTMAITGAKRTITTLGISYAWVTASVPVGAVLMIISTLIRLKECWNKPNEEWGEEK